jgi:hypothetical protein
LSYSIGLALSGAFFTVVGFLAFRFPRAFVRRVPWNPGAEPFRWAVASNRWFGAVLVPVGISIVVLAFIVR